MSPEFRQAGFLLSFYLFIVAARVWAHERWRRRIEQDRRRHAALERESRVGIPYDPPEGE